MECCCVVVCGRLKNVLFEMSSTDSSGVFDVNAKFMGVSMDKVQLLFQVTTQSARRGNVTVDARTQHGQSPAALPGNVGAAPAYVADDCLSIDPSFYPVSLCARQ